MGNPTLAAIERIDNLPTLPQVIIEVNRLMEDPEVSLKQVADLIATDLALAPRILKLVNSSFFGFPSRVSSIPRAVVLLGFNTVRNALFSVAVIDAMGCGRGDDTFDIKAFWKHSLAVAVIGRFICGQVGIGDKEDAFTAGLLHDIGKVVLWQHFNDRFSAVCAKADAEGRPFNECEDDALEFSHAAIGAHLARRWQLPEALQRAIRLHHLPDGHAHGEIEHMIHLADIVSHVMAEEMSGYRMEAAALDLQDPWRELLKTVHQWYPVLAEEIEAACQFFLKG